MTENQQEKIKSLRQAGLGYKKIAAAMSLSENTVKSYCRRHDFEQLSVRNHCRECGAPLSDTKGHRQRVFCSDKCRKQYWNRHQDEIKRRTAIKIVCPICHNAFYDYAGRHRKFCGRKCYALARSLGEIG